MEKIKKENTNELFLKWGNKKRLRCVRVKEDPSFDVSGRRRIRRKMNSSFVQFGSSDNHDLRQGSMPQSRLTRNSDASTAIRSEGEKGVVERPKMDAGGGVVVGESSSGGGSKSKQHVWPKLYIALTSKEKEEDFMAMKGCKPSHRPKKRAKMIQRTILLVSPGAWLTNMCQERYEVREKKTTKKRPTGLKAMGSMESDSE